MAKTAMQILLEQRQRDEDEEAGGGGGPGLPRLPSLGGVTALKEIGAGISGLLKLGGGALADLATGDVAGVGEKAGLLGKGLASSVLGTAATATKPFEIFGGFNPIEEAGEALLGEELRPRDFFEKVGNRGILPALIEDVGNVALAGAIARAPIRAGAKAAETAAFKAPTGSATRSAALERAAQLSSQADQLRPFANPYRSLVQSQIRPRTRAAQRRVVEAAGDAPTPRPLVRTADEMERAAKQAEGKAAAAEKRAGELRGQVEANPNLDSLVPTLRNAEDHAARLRAVSDETAAAARDAQGGTTFGRDAVLDTEAAKTPGGAAGEAVQTGKLRDRIRQAYRGTRETRHLPVGLGTRIAASAEGFIQSREVLREMHSQRRVMEQARREMLADDGVQNTVKLAEDFLVKARQLNPQEASDIVGEEIFARLSGLHDIGEEVLGGRHEILTETNLGGGGTARRHLAPADLRGNQEWERALADAVQARREAHARALDTLKQSRPGMKGLERAGVDDLELLSRQEQQVARAAKELGDATRLEGKIAKQRAIHEGRIDQAHDGVGRLAARLSRLEEARQGAVRAFDESRTYVPAAFRGERRARTYAAIIERTRQSWQESGRTAGGATFNPHGGAFFNPHDARFIELGEEGYMVGVVNQTGRKVHIDQLAPDDMDVVVRAFQELFDSEEVMLGTWVDAEGFVHIDPTQMAQTRDHALTLAAARGQEAVWANGPAQELDVILKNREDVAARFVDQHANRSREAAKLRDAADDGRHNFTHDDVDKAMALTDLLATTAFDKGKFAHPDHWYAQTRYEVRRGKRFLRKATKEVGLTQTYLRREYAPQLWDDVMAYLGPEQAEKAMGWYFRSNEWVTGKFKGKRIRLADGKDLPADEVFFQLLAVTSISAAPTVNLGNAMKAVANIHRFMEGPEFKQIRQHMADTLAKGSDQGWTRERIFEEMFPEAIDAAAAAGTSRVRKKVALAGERGAPLTGGRIDLDALAQELADAGEVVNLEALSETTAVSDALRGMNTHMYDMSKTLVWEILSGNTMDGWNANVINDITRAWTGQNKLTKPMREMVEAFGDEAVAMEHYGGQLWAKLRSFHSNLSDPANSSLVTLDSWMARLTDLENWDTPGAYATFAQKVRDIADYASRQMGRKVMPHEVQAAMWAFGKSEIGRQNWGRLMGFVGDALDDVEAGRWSPKKDPIADWFRQDIAGMQAAIRRKKRGGPGFKIEERTIARRDVRPVPTFSSMQRAEKNTFKQTMIEDGAYQPTGKKPLPSDKELEVWYKERFQRDLETTPVREEAQFKAHPTDVRKKLKPKQAAFKSYQKTQRQVAESLANGDRNGARAIMASWANRQKKILDEEWGDYNDVAANPTAEFAAAESNLREHGFFQSFERQILGEMMPKDTGYVIRLYRDADFTTLVHENAHVLRRMLPEAQVRDVERVYGVREGRWTREAEERFADDFTGFLAGYGQVGAVIRHQNLVPIFETVRRHLGEYWQDAAQHVVAADVHPQVARLFDDWLSPHRGARPEGVVGIELPQADVGSINQRGMRPPDVPLGTPQAAFRRGAKGQRAIRELEKIERRAKDVAAAKANAEKHLGRLQDVLENHELPAMVRQRQLRTQARRRLERIDTGLSKPKPSQVPRHWQPLWEAVTELRRMVETRPELAHILRDVPDTWEGVLSLAERRGFRPEHVRDFSQKQVRRLVFESMRVGRPVLGDIGEEVTTGTRQTSTGALRKSGQVDRSFESLVAGSIEALTEKHTNDLVTHIEQVVAKPIPEGGAVPPGWVEWDPQRHVLLTGEELTGGFRQAPRGATRMIPSPVAHQLRNMSKNQAHWVFDAAQKAMKPWRAVTLNLHPRYYLNNTVGNFMLATSEGVSFRDWANAWRLSRGQEVTVGGRTFQPAGVEGRKMRFAERSPVGGGGVEFETGLGREATLIRRQGGPGGVRRGLREGGARGAVSETTRGLRILNRLNENGDAFARSAVYFKKLRTGSDHVEALNAAYEALVDYGSLSPFERTAMRTLMPFYSWQKGIMKIAVKMPYDHPARMGVLMAMSQLNDDLAADQLGLQDPDQVPEWYRHMIGTDNFAIDFRAANPYADSFQLATPEGVVRSMNFVADAVLRKGFGAPDGGFAESYRMNPWGGTVPDTDLAGDLASQGILGQTILQTGAALGGAEELGGRPLGGKVPTVGRFLGVKVRTPEDLQRVRERVAKSASRLGRGEAVAGTTAPLNLAQRGRQLQEGRPG